MTEMKPHVGGDGVPRCSENECPSYDGKRCELIGCRPSLICEPAVIDMADRLRTPPVTGAAAMREAADLIEWYEDTSGKWLGTLGAAHRIAVATLRSPATNPQTTTTTTIPAREVPDVRRFSEPQGEAASDALREVDE